MRRMRILCAALACLLLTSCAPRVSGDPGAPDADPGVSPAAQSALSALPFPVGTLRDVNWGDEFHGCSDGRAFYSMAPVRATTNERGYLYTDWLLLRLDYETRVQTPLCGVPGCAHADTFCPAYVAAESAEEYYRLTIVDGQLYLMRLGWSDAYRQPDGSGTSSVWIERAAADGSGRARLAQLPEGWSMDLLPLTDGAALYGQYMDFGDYKLYGLRVDLESGEYTSFSFGLDSGEALLGAAGSQFVLSRDDSELDCMAYPEVMGQELYELKGDRSLLKRMIYCFDPATGARTVADWTPQEAEARTVTVGQFIRQGKRYDCLGTGGDGDPQTLWEYDLMGGALRSMAGRDWYHIEPLWLFPTGSGAEEPYLAAHRWSDRYSGLIDLIDTRDGTAREIGLRYGTNYGETLCAVPLAQTESGLWLVFSGQMEDSANHARYSLALAPPETVFSGEGETYPVQMWEAPRALG